MGNAARVIINEVDNTFTVAGFEKGIVGVVGKFKRGPVNNPQDYLFVSYNQFRKAMGEFTDGISDAPLLAKRMFDKGCKLRVVRVANYGDILDASSITATKANTPLTYILEFDDALITGNTINITIDGNAIAIPFSNTSDETLDNLRQAIDAVPGVLASVVDMVDGPVYNDRKVFFYSDPNNLPLALTAISVTGGASQANITATTLAPAIVTAANEPLFNIEAKYEGDDYNNIRISILAASNGQANFFNLAVIHATDNTIQEIYENIAIDGTPNIANSHYLDLVNELSYVVKVTYNDLSSLSTPLRPLNAIYSLVGGSDGSPITTVDYIGDDASRTGIRALALVDDILDFLVLDNDSVAIHNEGESYAASRQDLFYWGHISNIYNTADGLISQRALTYTGGNYGALTAGGLKIIHPISGSRIQIAEHADVVASQANTDYFYGPWYSGAGLQRGVLRDTLGVVNNFGSTGQFAELNALANRQVNMVIQKNGQVVFWGNYTLQVTNSQLTQISVRRFLIWLKKSLKPTLERYLFEPNDIPTWKKLYLEVDPFLSDLKAKRAVYDFQWQGDQFARSLDSLQVNDPTEVQQGKYKVKLLLKVIPAIMEIALEVNLTPLGISFEDYSVDFNSSIN